MKYVKKPVEIEAVQYLKADNIGQCLDFCGNDNLKYDPIVNEYYIHTLEGDMQLTRGDYIIKGVKGEFYPCKPDIFDATYSPVSSNQLPDSMDQFLAELKQNFTVEDITGGLGAALEDNSSTELIQKLYDMACKYL